MLERGREFPIQEKKVACFPRLDFFYMQSCGSIKLVTCVSRSLAPKRIKDLHVLPNFNGSIKQSHNNKSNFVLSLFINFLLNLVETDNILLDHNLMYGGGLYSIYT